MFASPRAWFVPLPIAMALSSPARAEDPPAKKQGDEPKVVVDRRLTVPALQELAAACAGDENSCKGALCDASTPFNFCDLRDEQLAGLALASDPATTRWLANRARDHLKKEPGTKVALEGLTADLAKAGVAPQPGESVAAAVADAVTGRTVEQQVALIAAGLARLVEDRMKQEGVGWAIDALGRDLCDVATDGERDLNLLSRIQDKELQARIRHELTENYLRSFCSLARSPRLAGYGSGAATLQIVRDAVEDDAKDLPGAVVGRGVVAAFYEVSTTSPVTGDAWAVQVATATARAAGSQYDGAHKGANTAAKWWGTRAFLPSRAATDGLARAGNRAELDWGRRAALVEAERNASDWSERVASDHSDDAAAPRLLEAIQAVDVAAERLGTYADAAAKAIGANGKLQDRRAATAAASAAREVAKAAREWAAEGAAVYAARPGVAACPTTTLDRVQGAWPHLGVARAAAAQVCTAGGSLATDPAYQAAHTELQREVAGFYRVGAARHVQAILAAKASLGQTLAVVGVSTVNANLVATAASDALLLTTGYDNAIAAREQTGEALRAAQAAFADVQAGMSPLELREATRVAIRRIVDGGDPLLALGELGRALDGANRRALTAERHVLRSVEIQPFACAISFPGAHRGVLDVLGVTDPSPATLAAALTTAPACWEIFGEGHTVDLASTESKTAWSAELRLALDEPGLGKRLERLTTARRLYQQLSSPENELVASWRHLVATQAKVQEQLDALAQDQAALLENVKTDGLGKQELDELQADVSAQLEAGRSLLVLQLGAMDDALDLASGIVATVRSGSGQVKGLCESRSSESLACEPPLGTAPLHAVDDAIAELRKGVALMKQAVAGKPAQVFATALADLPQLCAERAAVKEECEKAVGELATYGAGLATVAEARTADEAAEALSAVANPPGGWRIKQEPKTWTLSLTAHPGLMGGAEWRYGANGLVLEDGGPEGRIPYFAAPTLALPVGVEWHPPGWRHFSLYVPLLDPAAFLQYDVSESGDLPDPNLLTVLSPGATLRYGFPRTPFGLMGGVIYRPNLRSASGPAFSSQGANALQLVAAATVDVTLLSTHNRQKKAN